MQLRQRLGQAHQRRALHGAQAQSARGMVGTNGLARLLGQRQQLLRVAQQGFTGRGEQHAPSFTQKQRHAQLFFQLLDACGDVGLHAAQPFGGAGHAVLLCHHAEDLKRKQIHGLRLSKTIFV
ncbi:hypothetical protein SDC9_129253 [bioreactor metagenome]|uniref:Uncharacterized protein n=1 Tax=bioreactor metagenome TaxID=1076179 RepID=A0A645D058_9ZZZZ